MPPSRNCLGEDMRTSSYSWEMFVFTSEKEEEGRGEPRTKNWWTEKATRCKYRKIFTPLDNVVAHFLLLLFKYFGFLNFSHFSADVLAQLCGPLIILELSVYHASVLWCHILQKTVEIRNFKNLQITLFSAPNIFM